MLWLHSLCLRIAEFIVPAETIEYRILRHKSCNYLFKAQVKTRFGWRDICDFTNYNVDPIIQRHASGRNVHEVARRVFPREAA
jgi:hypothetical protein